MTTQALLDRDTDPVIIRPPTLDPPLAGAASSEPLLGEICKASTAVLAEAPLSSLPRLLMQHGIVGVIDGSGKAVGVLRLRDVFRAVGAHGRASLGQLTAGDVAGPAIIFAAHESARAASIVMAHDAHDAAVVIDDRGRSLGVWTAADALRYWAAQVLPAPEQGAVQRARDLTHAVPSVAVELSVGSLVPRLECAPEGLLVAVDFAMRPAGVVTAAHLIEEVSGHGRSSIATLTVRDVMVPEIHTIDAEASLEDVARKFAETRAAFLAVCEGDSLLGLLRAERLLSALRGGAPGDR